MMPKQGTRSTGRVGKGARFAPCPRGPAVPFAPRGHASLCPPYDSPAVRLTGISVSFSEFALDFADVATPIRGQYSIADIAMERAVRPIPNLRHVAVLHRIVVNVVDVPFEIGLVSDCMLPVTPLPKSAFPPGGFAGGARRGLHETSRKPRFDHAPTQRKIGVARRQRPDGVQVIRQNADCDGLKRITLVRGFVDSPTDRPVARGDRSTDRPASR
jgi:hypothetical protein